MRLYKFLEGSDGEPELESFPVEKNDGEVEGYKLIFWPTDQDMDISMDDVADGVSPQPYEAWRAYMADKEEEIRSNEDQIEELKAENEKLKGQIEKAKQIAEKEVKR